MRRLLFLVLLFSPSAHAVDYQFTPPNFPDGASGVLFHYYLPAIDKFASNVNLGSQAFAGSVEAYDELTQAQFRQYSFEVLRSEIRGNEIVYEYRGVVQERLLFWYARAIKHGNNFYVITATYPQIRAEIDGPALRAAVDSFQLK